MGENYTLFYFYDDFNQEIELYESKELTEPGELFGEELKRIFDQIEYIPGPRVLEKILNEA